MTLTTTLHTFCFDVSNDSGKAAWNAFKADRANGPHCHGPVISNLFQSVRELDGKQITLETTHLFENQWNTAPIDGVSEKGLRVFDYALESYDTQTVCPRYIRRGHWLEQTPAMRELRDNTNACGYCGAQEAAQKGYVFCPHCIDNEYLTDDFLHLTRMQAVSDRTDRAKLSDAERAHLLPLFRDAQIHGTSQRGKARIEKARADLLASCEKEIRNAKMERDGFLFFMDRGIRTDNLIFYSHTGIFCFGWRTPIESSLLGAILDVVSEFPFPYEIKTAKNTSAQGRTLSGGIG